MKRLWNDRRGMTLVELIIALALLAILVTFVTTGPAMYNYNSVKAANLQIVQESIEDAMVGYYAVTGRFPVLPGVDYTTKPHTLTSLEMASLFEDVTVNSGYVMFPREELDKYRFTVQQINSYKLRIDVEWAS